VGDLGLWTVFGSEVVGTAVPILLGTGVVANVSPARTYGTGGGVGVITLGWGLGVFAGVYAGVSSGFGDTPVVGPLAGTVPAGLFSHVSI
jgi:glycerol uptake facilitator protein